MFWFVQPGYSWFLRGAVYSGFGIGNSAGVFAYANTSGLASYGGSFRVVYDTIFSYIPKIIFRMIGELKYRYLIPVCLDEYINFKNKKCK